MKRSELRRMQPALTAGAKGTFDEADIRGLPGPVQEYFRAAVAPGSPLVRSAWIEMTGHIKIGRWIPFRADEILTPHLGFVWAARAGGVVSGSDRFMAGAGAMSWNLFGLVPVLRASGLDVSRSAAERAAAEAIWIPTSLHPRFGAAWSAAGPGDISAHFACGSHPVTVALSLTPDGLPRSFRFDRWGDPDGSGTFGLHAFGGEFTSHASFDGYTIPTEGRLGWHHGTAEWDRGEFFRYEITGYHPLPIRDAA